MIEVRETMDRQDLLQFDVAYPGRLRRWLIFFRGLFIIPHSIILYFLLLALSVVTFVAWWAILFTGRYPEGMWSFSMSVMRWAARVQVYTMNLRDEYPPLGEGAYPIRFDQARPARQSRWLLFARPFMLIPHYICLMVIGVASSVVALVACVSVLILGRMPRGMFTFITGSQRWIFRVYLFQMLLTDAYPPFSMDGDGSYVEVAAPAFAGNA